MSLPPRGRRGRGGQDGHDPRARIRTRERRTMDLTVLGWSQHQIAADLGVTQAAVSKILNRVERRALRELTATVERHKVRHTLRLDHIYAEAMRAWEGRPINRTLRAQQRIDHLSRLRAYVVDTRGWRTNVTTLSDLQGLVDRYEPSGRQWAMRFLAQVKDMAVSELYLTELRIDSTTETWAVAT